MRLGRGGGGGGWLRGMMVQRAAVLGVTRMVNLADRAYIPLTMDMNVSKVVALKGCLSVTGVVVRKRASIGTP